MDMGKSPMTSIVAKLNDLAGPKPTKSQDWRIRVRLNWHDKARSAIRHMLAGTRKITHEEARQIEAGHLRYCAEKAEANRAETQKLFASMRTAIAAMERSDPAFFGEQIAAMREVLLRPRKLSAPVGNETGGDEVSE